MNTKKHLRLRGENEISGFFDGEEEETPPLTRRKLIGFLFAGSIIRNTSAYAEKTLERMEFVSSLRKHLRLRGENPQSSEQKTCPKETPPLTRRKL